MTKLMKKQKGIGFIALMICFAIFGLLVYLIMALWPLYYEKMTVVASMKYVSSQPNSAQMSVSEARKAFLRNINATSNVKKFGDKNIKNFLNIAKASKKNNTPRLLVMQYESSNNVFKDIYFTIKFDESMPMTNNK